MKEKVSCTGLIRQLLEKDLPYAKILERVRKISPKPLNWTLGCIQAIHKKIGIPKKAMKFTFKKKNTKKAKVCKWPGCDKHYVGHPISKYCPLHSDVKNRKIKKTKLRELGDNRIIDHSFDDFVSTTLSCMLEGCSQTFEIEIAPTQYIYPKYCPTHRNKFQREAFLKARQKCQD